MTLPEHLDQAITGIIRRFDLTPEAKAEIVALIEATRGSALNTPMTLVGEPGDGNAPPVATGRPNGDFGRYDLVSKLGEGGASTVLRVFDPDLNRTVAAKLLREGLVRRRGQVQRFLEEGCVIAQLDHPGIIPIHEIGRLPTLQPYYTMREVHGQTLADLIAEVHRASGPKGWQTSTSGWTLHRLVEAFRRVCETVAYAHSRGVVHRDLKPANVMTGRFGEVYTLDFGLAKIERDLVDDGEIAPARPPSVRETIAGTILGTPAYMAPEQGRGDADAVGPLSDVYSLGAILFEILAGRPPYEGATSDEVLENLSTTEPPLPAELALASGTAPPVPPELQAICMRAMARQPAARYSDASTLAGVVGDWLEGAQRREIGLRFVAEADVLAAEGILLRERAAIARAQAQSVLMSLPPFAPVAAKAAAWAIEDQAAQDDASAGAKEVEYTERLISALSHATDLAEAHSRLADHSRRQHAAAEQARRADDAQRFEIVLRSHEHGRHAGYLRGVGTLSVVTDPPDAEVDLYRFEARDRRQLEQFVRSLGRAPIHQIELPIGSYLLVLKRAGFDEVRYPVFIERLSHWDGVAPAETTATAIRLPRLRELAPDDVLIPSGWFISGGDGEALNGLPRQRLWLDAFVMRRHPVTNAQYLAFLNDLLVHEREADAVRFAPRERGAGPGQEGSMICQRDAEGQFLLHSTAANVPLLPDLPICMVDWQGAAAYSAWYAGKMSAPWRLPGEMEWEKSARGTDGRGFPWGDFLDPTWCLMRLSHSEMGRAFMAGVEAHPTDCSPYGVRGLAGNARDWCFDAYQPMGPKISNGRPVLSNGEDVQGPGALGAHRVYRGGTWRDGDRSCRAAFRDAPPAYFRDWDISFRLARPFV